jgi:hypothetical protein
MRGGISAKQLAPILGVSQVTLYKMAQRQGMPGCCSILPKSLRGQRVEPIGSGRQKAERGLDLGTDGQRTIRF